MVKKTFENTLSYQYDATRERAKYTLDGKKYMNHGDFCEVLAKHCLGFKAEKDKNTRFDMGADIPELNASVKSIRCGLTDTKLGNEAEIWWNRYWAMCDTTQIIIWVCEHDEEVDLWFMNHEEFKEFCEKFAKWDDYCKKFRISTCSNKTNAWLEGKL